MAAVVGVNNAIDARQRGRCLNKPTNSQFIRSEFSILAANQRSPPMLNPTEQELVHIAHHTLCVEGRSYAVFPRSDKETGPHTSNPFIMRKKYFSSTRNCRHKQYERKAGPNFERHEGSKRSGHPSYFKAKFDVPVFFIAQHVGMKLRMMNSFSVC